MLDRQLDAHNEAGCERIFEDHASGAAPERPNLNARLDQLREGDVLVVLDLDRLGRRAGELTSLIDELDRRGVGSRAQLAHGHHHADRPGLSEHPGSGRRPYHVSQGLEPPRNPGQFRNGANVIRWRVLEGVKAARARGRKGGRPRIVTVEKLRYAQSLMADRLRSIPDICSDLGDLPTSTLYHYPGVDGTLKDPRRRLLEA